ncbi:hypothetical protein [Bradyrhizobium diazoefficiens]|uniref:hypothetical protein n=1 Tax=Bradyrhizobium diazoefficiens TaxID=1355477 RepID=UPI0032E0463D
MKYLQVFSRPYTVEADISASVCHPEKKPMTRLTPVVAALIAAAVYQTQAASARDIAPRRAATHATADCVRAPAAGAYATAPYKQPPCLPNTTTN